MFYSSPFARRLFPGLIFGLLVLAGCGHLRPHTSQEYVYVWARGTYLRDRVAAVSNRVAEVSNGQRLQVMEHGRRFLKVRTEKGEVGWIEEHGVIDQETYDKFTQLVQDNAKTPVVGTAVLRDDYWLRDAPGRSSDRFYLLPESDKLQLLKRASVPRPQVAQALPVPLEKPVSRTNGDAASVPPPANLEDYWLIRDSNGHVGWVRGRTLDVDVPDAIAGLAEGQRIVAAYVLKKVNDPESTAPSGQVAEYVAFLSPWKDGLPYDFDQVRVFTWNTKKHRYETAYRERNVAGYLPVAVTQASAENQGTPAFSFRVAAGDQAALDPQTGMVNPGDTVTESFRLEGVLVHRDGAAPPRSIPAPAPTHRQRKPHHKHR
ncbi:MAG TPA: SH3 domain-containing protein [Acidobacteriaceae bacterium]|nr:SH3 domain-containing protein [Acidobacteriaceae bacterium]